MRLSLQSDYLQRAGTACLIVKWPSTSTIGYYGQYLPQLFVAGIAPVGIFAFMAILDLPSALIFLFSALLTLFAPTFFRRATSSASQGRRRAFSALASEFVDAVQGLATLKVFGQSGARGAILATKARDVYASTMKVLAVNIASGGVGTLCMSLAPPSPSAGERCG